MVALPNLPSLVAVIVVVPVASAATTPLLETVATAPFVVAHVTGRSVTTAPFASRTVAMSVVVCPTASEAVGGSTVTVPTPGIVTVAVTTAVFPSLLATMFAPPGATPVMTPDVETVATPGLCEVNVTNRPVNTNPSGSLSVTFNATVCCTITVGVVGEISTLATGAGFTTTPAAPDWPSLVAVIAAVPGATAVTTPDCETVATAVLLELQTITRFDTIAPVSSRTVAVSCTLPRGISVLLVGATETLATLKVDTVSVALPVLPSTVAVIVVVPTASALTTP
jgi:hypothetical protein